MKNLLLLSLSIALLACTNPGEKTTIGAAAGGALGAGIGAIVGNQAGSAGGGLAIGAVAGASTGALIANALEAQDKSIKEQDEALERQEQTIKAQKAQLQEFRRGGIDSPGSGSRNFAPGDKFAQSGGSTPAGKINYNPSKAAPGDLYLSNSGSQPKARSDFNSIAAPESSSPPARALSRFDSENEKSASAPRAMLEPLHENDNVGAYKAPSPILEAEPSSDTGGSKSLLETDITDVSNTPSNQIQATSPAVIQDAVEPKTSAASLIPEAPKTCNEASVEIGKAEKATDAGDKLFHYRRALRMCPKDAGIHVAIGDLYLGLNRVEDARFEYDEAKAANPNFPGLDEKIAKAQ